MLHFIKKIFFCSLLIAILVCLPVLGAGATALSDVPTDSLIKAQGSPEVYYYAPDGKRYLFPNEKIYKSWFVDFSKVLELDAATVGQIPLGGNIYYRPGVVLVKIPSNPKVYVVTENGVLRSIKSEALAQKLYGTDWRWLVDDLPESFFVNYTLGQELESEADYDAEAETNKTPTLNHNHHWRVSADSPLSTTTKCRAIPAVPAKKIGKKGPATPAVPARDCAHAQKQNHHQALGSLSFSELQVTATTTSATLSWLTNRATKSQIAYATTTLATASNIIIKTDDTFATSHSLVLLSLAPATTYYYKITATDADNKVVNLTQTFMTTALPDTVSPIISNVTVSATSTSARLSWTTSEPADSAVEYATSTLTAASYKFNIISPVLTQNHQLELNNLTATTTYYYILKSADRHHNATATSEATFLTP